MDEMRIAQDAAQREATRVLGLDGRRARANLNEVALTGAEAEAAALPALSSQDLTDADGNELFVVGITSPFSSTARLSW